MCQIDRHPMRKAVEVQLAAKRPAHLIAEEFGVHVSAVGYFKSKLKTDHRQYWRQLRRVVKERGITKHSFQGSK